MAGWLVQYRWERRPPRKIRTAYSYFVKDNYHKIRHQLGTRHTKELFEVMGQIWRNLSAEERLPYRKKELEDRRRFAETNASWVRYFEGRIPRMRRRKKTKDFPLRTRNAYVWYIRENYPKFKSVYTDWSQQEIYQEMSAMWKKMTKEEKEPYVILCGKDEQRYADEVLEYRREKWRVNSIQLAEKHERRYIEIREKMHAKSRADILLSARKLAVRQPRPIIQQ